MAQFVYSAFVMLFADSLANYSTIAKRQKARQRLN